MAFVIDCFVVSPLRLHLVASILLCFPLFVSPSHVSPSYDARQRFFHHPTACSNSFNTGLLWLERSCRVLNFSALTSCSWRVRREWRANVDIDLEALGANPSQHGIDPSAHAASLIFFSLPTTLARSSVLHRHPPRSRPPLLPRLGLARAALLRLQQLCSRSRPKRHHHHHHHHHLLLLLLLRPSALRFLRARQTPRTTAWALPSHCRARGRARISSSVSTTTGRDCLTTRRSTSTLDGEKGSRAMRAVAPTAVRAIFACIRQRAVVMFVRL